MGKFVRVFCTSVSVLSVCLCACVRVFYLFMLDLRQFHMYVVVSVDEHHPPTHPVHTYIRTYIHTYIQTYIDTYMPTYIRTYLHR